MPDSLHASVTLHALRMAIVRRNPPRELVYHSDRGMQYVCRECRELLEEIGMRQSMSRAGD
jgi:transposase InsO family protein